MNGCQVSGSTVASYIVYSALDFLPDNWSEDQRVSGLWQGQGLCIITLFTIDNKLCSMLPLFNPGVYIGTGNIPLGVG